MRAFRASLDGGVAALSRANESLDLVSAERMVEALVSCTGRRLCTGVGKSGLVAARMAASLNSIGLPAQWVHGAEWVHGDLGAMSASDTVLAVSHSGTTAELLQLATHIRSRRVQLLAFTGAADTPLAKLASVSLACEAAAPSELLGLLPTTSTLVTHHVFNALLSECASRLTLTSADVLKQHPGGQIGRRASSEQTESESRDI